ncbi:hypothetical protein [Cochleicola gelatinilyticus]|nr:hypothetical protein [Cochleicola gelatinilyticus]
MTQKPDNNGMKNVVISLLIFIGVALVAYLITTGLISYFKG